MWPRAAEQTGVNQRDGSAFIRYFEHTFPCFHLKRIFGSIISIGKIKGFTSSGVVRKNHEVTLNQ